MIGLRGHVQPPDDEVEYNSENRDLAWAELLYMREQVDGAGQVLISDEPIPWSDDEDDPTALSAEAEALERYEDALRIINNWRSSHSFPLNTFQVTLRGKAKSVDSQCLVAQRIKRLHSINLKLRRFPWLTLSEMQDIGGCRVVVRSTRAVEALVDEYKNGNLKHKLDDSDDYISKPKASGYRGVHLIYRYHSGRKETYNGLKIEMQFRSTLQHAWATAVETVGTFTRQALKSSQGRKDWLRFFTLMGAALARREKTPAVPNTPTSEKGLVRELRKFAQRLEVEQRLRAYGSALNAVEVPGLQDSHYFLLTLDPGERRVVVAGYKLGEFQRASEEYLRTEREIAGRSGAEAVLVSVDSLSALRRAYPNYFLDTDVFLAAVEEAIK